MLSIQLPEDVETRLTQLERKTGHSKTYYIQQALREYLDDLEDDEVAEERLRHVDDKKVVALSEVMGRVKAILEQNGEVRLRETIHPPRQMRAILTLLEPVETNGNRDTVLALLRSPAFQNAAPGNPTAMDAVIQANCDAWDG